MTKEELVKLIAQGENEQLEFKKSFDAKALIAINALANTQGGIVLVGIIDTGAICGVSLTTETLQNWINEIKQKTEPSIVPYAEIIQIEDNTIVVFKIDEHPIKPIAIQGRYYQRKNNSNHLLSLNNIADLHLQSLQVSWDSYEYPKYKIAQLSIKKIESFLFEINNTGRYSSKGDSFLMLNKLSLIKNDRPTIASVLLFAEIPERHHIRIGRFKSESTILDDRQITETLFEAAEESLKFIKNYIQLEYLFDGNIKRTERWEYPIQAIKESLLNAIVHRDYREPNDIQVHPVRYN